MQSDIAGTYQHPLCSHVLSLDLNLVLTLNGLVSTNEGVNKKKKLTKFLSKGLIQASSLYRAYNARHSASTSAYSAHVTPLPAADLNQWRYVDGTDVTPAWGLVATKA